MPAEWLADVLAATEDSLLALVDHLPAEAAEALLELATGGKPAVPEYVLDRNVEARSGQVASAPCTWPKASNSAP